MSDLKEFIVTLKDKNDLENFYLDLESSVGSEYIPNRIVEILNKRPMSRNTHILISNQEAIQLKDDPRVLDVHPASILRKSISPKYFQSGNFSKSTTQNASHLNWGQLRCILGEQIERWGSDDITSVNSEIKLNYTGKNVDVIIIDGHLHPTHPEFQINPDGTGGSRVIQFNWFQLNNTVQSIDNDGSILLPTNYVYTPYDTGYTKLTQDNNHGAHVAGIVAGNTKGWARDANIYNINPFSTDSNQLDNSVIWDYIRAFHLTKEINPTTGRKNPTICVASYGTSLEFPISDPDYTTGPITFINYRNKLIGTPSSITPLTDQEVLNAGIRIDNGVAEVPIYFASISADVEDAIADGIIVVGAAGNEFSKVDVPGGIDFNNYFYAEYDNVVYQWYSHRGTLPSAAPSAICVGAVDSLANEVKGQYSNCGPRVDVYAPGTSINSSVNNSKSFGGIDDPRLTTFKQVKLTGTSMAAPQVAGVLACILELYPDFTPAQAKEWIIRYAKPNQLFDPLKISLTWNVTNNGSSSYSFTGENVGENVSITCVEGNTLVFNINSPGHPFWIKREETTGQTNGVTTGIINANGIESGTIIWDTTGVRAGTYFYICEYHGVMLGTITVLSSQNNVLSLQGSNNRYLFAYKERFTEGNLFPKKNNFIRPTSGILYPRSIIKRK